MAQWELRSGTGVERLLFFSDAVVAVAITILALPLVDIEGPKPGENVLDVVQANSGSIITFVSTFFVMAMMWSVHNRVMNSLATYDAAIFWLNMFWLIGFVFLPWPSAMYGGGDDWGAVDVTLFSSDGTGALYWWTMAYISGIGSLTSWYIGRHPQFLKPEDRAYWAGLAKTRARLRGVAFFSVFVIAGASTLVLSYLGFYALLLIWPLNWALQPSRAQRAALGSGANADIAPPG
ncbi:MAG: hypothetical protein RLZ94_1736 [Actinomycetota bacterium]